MESNYKVFFQGELVPGTTVAEAKRKIKSVFKLSEEEVEQWFSGGEKNIKENGRKRCPFC